MDVTVDFEPGELDMITDPEKFAQAVLPAALEEVRAIWIEAVTGGQLPGMDRTINDDAYAAALRDPAAAIYPYDGDVTVGAVQPVAGPGYDRAERLEQGRNPRDMKYALTHGPRSRQGTHGRYNIIPLKRKGFFAALFGGVDFRTVSERSPADSWIYPGVPPAHIVDAVTMASLERIGDVIERALNEWR